MKLVLLITILIFVTILLIGNFWIIRHIYGLNRTLISLTIQRDKERDQIKEQVNNIQEENYELRSEIEDLQERKQNKPD